MGVEMIEGHWYWTKDGRRAVLTRGITGWRGMAYTRDGSVVRVTWDQKGVCEECLVLDLAEHYGPTMPPTIERPKPEPKYVPYTWEDREQIRGKWARCGQTEASITSVHVNRVRLNGTWHTFREAFRDWTHLDGTPFGKRVDS